MLVLWFCLFSELISMCVSLDFSVYRTIRSCLVLFCFGMFEVCFRFCLLFCVCLEFVLFAWFLFCLFCLCLSSEMFLAGFVLLCFWFACFIYLFTYLICFSVFVWRFVLFVFFCSTFVFWSSILRNQQSLFLIFYLFTYLF